MDEYKREALVRTWEQVNRDFGAIFGDLLPGNSAKLTPADGRDLMSGLEVQVCLGGVWKENLTELSGGQRYLLFFFIFIFYWVYKMVLTFYIYFSDRLLHYH